MKPSCNKLADLARVDPYAAFARIDEVTPKRRAAKQLREALQTFTERTRVELVLDEALKYLERWCVAQG